MVPNSPLDFLFCALGFLAVMAGLSTFIAVVSHYIRRIVFMLVVLVVIIAVGIYLPGAIKKHDQQKAFDAAVTMLRLDTTPQAETGKEPAVEATPQPKENPAKQPEWKTPSRFGVIRVELDLIALGVMAAILLVGTFVLMALLLDRKHSIETNEKLSALNQK